MSKTLSCITKHCSLTTRDLFPAYLSGVVTGTFAVVAIRSLASFPAIAVIESEQLLRVGTLIIGANKITKLCFIQRTVWLTYIITICGICTFNKHICAGMLLYCISAYVRVYLHAATSVVAPLLAFPSAHF